MTRNINCDYLGGMRPGVGI